MPALFFPNLDALRLVLASGVVPPAVARAPGRAGFDAHGRLWLEPAELPPREALAAAGRPLAAVPGAGLRRGGVRRTIPRGVGPPRLGAPAARAPRGRRRHAAVPPPAPLGGRPPRPAAGAAPRRVPAPRPRRD